eukprot:g8611.t1
MLMLVYLATAPFPPADSRRVQVEAEGEEVKPQRPTEMEEERLRAKALMPKKHKRLLQRIENAEAKKKEQSKRLKKKAQAADA